MLLELVIFNHLLPNREVSAFQRLPRSFSLMQRETRDFLNPPSTRVKLESKSRGSSVFGIDAHTSARSVLPSASDLALSVGDLRYLAQVFHEPQAQHSSKGHTSLWSALSCRPRSRPAHAGKKNCHELASINSRSTL